MSRRRKREQTSGRCEVCDQPAQLVPGTGLCGACCTGEADMFEPTVSASNLELSISELDKVLKQEKGWHRHNNQAPEWVYEYCVPDSFIRMRVMSGISVRTQRMDCPGLDNIRIFAIFYRPLELDQPKLVTGLCKARVIRPAPGWEERLKRAYIDVLQVAKKRAQSLTPKYRMSRV